MRRAIVELLGQLDAASLATHAPTVVALLEDANAGVRLASVQTLGRLDAASLATHAPAIVAKLVDENKVVRKAVVATLGKLDAKEGRDTQLGQLERVSAESEQRGGREGAGAGKGLAGGPPATATAAHHGGGSGAAAGWSAVVGVALLGALLCRVWTHVGI